MLKGTLPVNKDEMKKAGWKKLDVIIVTGDSYVDHNYFLLARVGRFLESKGIKVGILDQADCEKDKDWFRLGTPQLFFLVMSGEQDSMQASYTAFNKFKTTDPHIAGGKRLNRPDRALIKYTNKIKELFKEQNKPIILAGLEASLRRFTHYDFKSDKLRKPILFDAKADLVVFGQPEITLLNISKMLKNKGKSIKHTLEFKGTAYISNEKPEVDYRELTEFEELTENGERFAHYTKTTSIYSKPEYETLLIQKIDSRYLVVNPPFRTYEEEEMDQIYELNYTKHPHKKYKDEVPYFKYLKDAIVSHQGSYSGESYTYDHMMNGRDISQRSYKSILNEMNNLAKSKSFNKIFRLFVGPASNMYGSAIIKKSDRKQHEYPSYLYPQYHGSLKHDYRKVLSIFERGDAIKGLKNNFIYHTIDWHIYRKIDDLQKDFIKNRSANKVTFAIGSLNPNVCSANYISNPDEFLDFLEEFNKRCGEYRKRLQITLDIIGGLPGETLESAVKTAILIKEMEVNVEINVTPYYPLPGTNAACIYFTGLEPYTSKKVIVSKSMNLKKDICTVYKFQKKGFKNQIKAILRKNNLEEYSRLIE